MKKLHKLILKSFIGPFLASFSVVLFILILQFLQRYQNDLFGKGLGASVISEIFFYAGVQLALLAMPIGVLLSSLSTMGNLGETYEITAMKASGISLYRIIQPMFVIVLFVTGFSFLMAFYLVPKANLKLYTLIFNAQQAKPQFALRPGYFDNKFDGYSMYFSSRSPSGRLYNIKIWDHTKSPVQTNFLYADSADVTIDNRLLFLRLNLYSGEQHESQPQGIQYGSTETINANPYSILKFDSLKYKLDLSGFGLKGTEEDAFKSHYFMLTGIQLLEAIDSVNKLPAQTVTNLYNHADNYLRFEERKKKVYKDYSPLSKEQPEIHEFFTYTRKYDIYRVARNNIKSIQSFLEYSRTSFDEQSENLRRYKIEYQLKWLMPLSCIVMLFIGAPLGAIIRKGGIGMPTVISLLFFILFYILMTHGRKLARENVLEVWAGVWLPMFVLLPVALYTTYLSVNDAKLFDKSFWNQTLRGLIERLNLFFKKKKKDSSPPSNFEN